MSEREIRRAMEQGFRVRERRGGVQRAEIPGMPAGSGMRAAVFGYGSAAVAQAWDQRSCDSDSD